MTRLRKAANDYIAIRRNMGFKFEDAAKLLLDFVEQLEAGGSGVITTAAAVSWAQSVGGHPNWWGKRLSVVRGFTRHLQGLEPGHEVLPAGMFPTGPLRATPYLYECADVVRLIIAARSLRIRSWARTMETIVGLLAVTGMQHEQPRPPAEVPPADLLGRPLRRSTAPNMYSKPEIAALMAAARTLDSPLRAATYETLIGLLAVTGMRIGECIRLDRNDVDQTNHILIVRDTKFGKSREVTLHLSTVEAIEAYDRVRQQRCARPRTPAFFVSRVGTRLHYNAVHRTFRGLRGFTTIN